MTDSTKPTVVSNLKPATVYAWAYENHITTLPFENARLYNTILRYEAAKMIVQFAENVLKKQIVHNSMCIIGNYKDFGQFDTETKGNITKICDLGLMGRKGTTNTLLDSFRLFSTLSTEELNIIIGRYWKNDAFAVKNNRRIDVMNFLYQAAHQ